ncbi:hypothetical protein Gocc_1835 [Gaiella occulta]|uniref:Uncharacterized protein n=1 Tax=Gaiella occulta TaxID=1002870 RepID=A0A7M2YXE9_9ACTN|nr:hypothetical protein Gocc_1835 [Gaiella occulta]
MEHAIEVDYNLETLVAKRVVGKAEILIERLDN